MTAKRCEHTIDGIPALDYLHSVGWGDLSAITSIHKSGGSTALGAAWQTMWEGTAALYAYLAAASVLKISSSSTADDGGGTGALTVRIWGLDANYAAITEDIILTGQTEVNTVNEYLRIYRMRVLTSGTGLTNAGNIWAGTGTVTAGVPAVKYAMMPATDGSTSMCIYTIPADYEGLIIHADLSVVAAKGAKSALFTRILGETFVANQRHIAEASNVSLVNSLPLYVDEKTDIELRAKITTGTTPVAAGNFVVLLRKKAA